MGLEHTPKGKGFLEHEKEIPQGVYNLVEDLMHPDATFEGPFLSGIASSLPVYRNQRKGSRGPLKSPLLREVDALSQRSVCFLNDMNWTYLPSVEKQALMLYEPKGRSGYPAGSPSIRILGMGLGGATVNEMADFLSHRGITVTLDALQIIHEELKPYSQTVTTSRLSVSADFTREDMYPFMDMNEVPAETWGPMVDAIQNLTNNEVITYGGINLDVLFQAAIKKYPSLAKYARKAEICADLDVSLGLHMPDVWYFNPAWPSLTTALFYNYVQVKPYWDSPNSNGAFRKLLGLAGLVEVYSQEQLQHFAKNEHYTTFSTPYDLVVTLEYMTSGKLMRHMKDDQKFISFSEKIYVYYARLLDMHPHELKQKLADLNSDERRSFTIAMLRAYWQNVLVRRGVKPNDMEIILLDNRKTGNLESNRRPSVVFIGGNSDYFYPHYDTSTFLSRNLELARRQYTANTKILLLRFHDDEHVWLAQLIREPGNATSATSLMLSLSTLRIFGYQKEYRDLRHRYHEIYKYQRSHRPLHSPSTHKTKI